MLWLVVWRLISPHFLFFKLLESVWFTFHFFVFLVLRFDTCMSNLCGGNGGRRYGDGIFELFIIVLSRHDDVGAGTTLQKLELGRPDGSPGDTRRNAGCL